MPTTHYRLQNNIHAMFEELSSRRYFPLKKKNKNRKKKRRREAKNKKKGGEGKNSPGCYTCPSDMWIVQFVDEKSLFIPQLFQRLTWIRKLLVRPRSRETCTWPDCPVSLSCLRATDWERNRIEKEEEKKFSRIITLNYRIKHLNGS